MSYNDNPRHDNKLGRPASARRLPLSQFGALRRNLLYCVDVLIRIQLTCIRAILCALQFAAGSAGLGGLVLALAGCGQTGGRELLAGLVALKAGLDLGGGLLDRGVVVGRLLVLLVLLAVQMAVQMGERSAHLRLVAVGASLRDIATLLVRGFGSDWPAAKLIRPAAAPLRTIKAHPHDGRRHFRRSDQQMGEIGNRKLRSRSQVASLNLSRPRSN